MDTRGLYTEAAPFYTQANMLTEADAAIGNMSSSGIGETYQNIADLAVTLKHLGKTWGALQGLLNDDAKAALASFDQYNNSWGYMYGGLASLIGVGEVTWPMPLIDSSMISDTTMVDSLVGGGAKPAPQGNQLLPAVKKINKVGGAFAIYPNPTNGNFTISTPQQGKFYLYSLLGQQVGMYEVKGGVPVELRMPEGLAPGIYMGHYAADDGKQQWNVRMVYEQQ